MIKSRLPTILSLSNYPFIPMQAILFLTLTINQSQNYLINFNFLTNHNQFKLIMRGWLYLDIMHVDHANLIMRYLSIWRFDLETGHTIANVRTLRSFLWYEMNELMHVMQSWILGIWLVTQSSSLIKSWVQNRVSRKSRKVVKGLRVYF